MAEKPVKDVVEELLNRVTALENSGGNAKSISIKHYTKTIITTMTANSWRILNYGIYMNVEDSDYPFNYDHLITVMPIFGNGAPNYTYPVNGVTLSLSEGYEEDATDKIMVFSLLVTNNNSYQIDDNQLGVDFIYFEED